MGLFDWLFGRNDTRQPDRPQRPRPSGPAQGGWQVGDRVLASWFDAYFYPGRIRSVQGASCEVAFDDSDVAWIHQANIREPDIRVGSQVFCRIGGGPYYLPGVVRQQQGEKIHVHYDNGKKEWTTISMVRVKRPLANVPEAFPQPQQAPFPQGPMMGGGMMGGPMTGTAVMTGAGPPGPNMPPQIPDVGDPIDDSDWRVGDRVLGRWFDLFWYPGTILAIGTKGYHLLFDDGYQRVVQDVGLMPLNIEEGEEIFIRPKNQAALEYPPARVTRVNGEMIDVEFEDGTRETNQKISRARLWRCPVGIKVFPFEEGERVWARDIDTYTYPAEILSIDGDKIVVHFLDGPERMLTPELVKRFEVKVGTAVECRWKGGPVYFRGKISVLEGDRVHISYDDGDKEWNTVRLIRLPPA
jgi:hypothetical protein